MTRIVIGVFSCFIGYLVLKTLKVHDVGVGYFSCWLFFVSMEIYDMLSEKK